MGGRLCVRVGDPADVVPDIARAHGAETVHVSREYSPFGVARDRRVAGALAAIGVTGEATGSPYAVDPGVVRTGSGTPYQVFTPYPARLGGGLGGTARTAQTRVASRLDRRTERPRGDGADRRGAG